MFKSFTAFLYNLSLHRINIFRVIFIFLLLSGIKTFSTPGGALPGDLDITFNQAGVGGQQGCMVFKIDPTEMNSAGFGTEIYNGKIVVSGNSYIDGANRFAVARLNEDGTFDITFNGTGKNAVKIDLAELSSEGLRVAIQPDGKILVCGIVNVNVESVPVTKFAVARFKDNGLLDETFNPTGQGGQPGTASVEIIGSNYAKCYALMVQSDGKIVLAGDVNIGSVKSFAVVRFSETGILDQDFNRNGSQMGVALTTIENNTGDHECFSGVLDANGKIVLAGCTTDGSGVKKFGVARFNTDGTIDEDFNADGVQKGTTSTIIDDSIQNNCYCVLMQADGKIVLTGNCYDDVNSSTKFSAARFNADGTIDESFNAGGLKKGTVSTQVDDSTNSMGTYGAIQANGKVLVTGMVYSDQEYKFAMARFKNTGEIDPTFNSNGILPGTKSVKVGPTSISNIVYSSKIQTDGKIVLTGFIYLPDSTSQFAVARFIGDYTPVDPVDPVITIPNLKTRDPFALRLISKYGLNVA